MSTDILVGLVSGIVGGVITRFAWDLISERRQADARRRALAHALLLSLGNVSILFSKHLQKSRELKQQHPISGMSAEGMKRTLGSIPSSLMLFPFFDRFDGYLERLNDEESPMLLRWSGVLTRIRGLSAAHEKAYSGFLSAVARKIGRLNAGKGSSDRDKAAEDDVLIEEYASQMAGIFEKLVLLEVELASLGAVLLWQLGKPAGMDLYVDLCAHARDLYQGFHVEIPKQIAHPLDTLKEYCESDPFEDSAEAMSYLSARLRRLENTVV